MFPKAASSEKRAAKYRHQAAQYGQFAMTAVDDEDADLAYGFARAAGRFYSLAARHTQAA